jgi:hypothetical protein
MSSKEKESVSDLLKSFIVFDLVFTISFCLGGLIEYERDLFIIVFVVITLITYYPLYLYVKDYLSMFILKEKSWYFRHLNTALFYCFFRIFLIFVYLVVAIIDMSDIDVLHAIVHLPVFSKIMLALMITSAFCLVFLALRIVPFHYNYAFNTVTNVIVNASIIHTTDPNYGKRYRYSSVSQLNLEKARGVYLNPSPLADDHTLLVTQYTDTEFEVEGR